MKEEKASTCSAFRAWVVICIRSKIRGSNEGVLSPKKNSSERRGISYYAQ